MRLVAVLALVGWLPLLFGGSAGGSENEKQSASGVRFALSNDGCIMTWLVCGPFPNPAVQKTRLPGLTTERPGFDTDWLQSQGGEKRVEPRAGASVDLEGQPPRVWRPAAAEAEGVGYVNLFGLMYPNVHVVAYAACTIHCPRAAAAQLTIGSNDGIKVWLNGKHVHTARRPRSWTQDEDRVAIRLRRGPNRLLLKIDQVSSGWGYSVRLRDAADRPLRGVIVELPGEAAGRDVLRMFARALELKLDRPALSAGETLVARVRFGPTAPTTDTVLRAVGFVDDRAGTPVATLGTLRLTGRRRTFAFAPWPVPQLDDGRYRIRVDLTTENGKRLAQKRATWFYVHAYAERLAEAKQAVEHAAADWKDTTGVLATITLPSLQRLIVDAEKRWAELNDFDRDSSYIRGQLRDAEEGARDLKRGRDWFAVQAGPLVKAYRSERDGTLQHYSVYVPRDYDPATSWPLVISLHGVQISPSHHMRRLFGKGNRPGETDEEARKFMPPLPDVPMLVACPNGRDTFGYQGLGEEDVWRVLADMKRAYNVDDTRVYLAGVSMGGTGAWQIALRHPDQFAAIAPICGETDYRYVRRPLERVEPYQRPVLEAQSAIRLAENALNLPVHIFQGTLDTVIPPANADEIFRRFKELGYRVAYTQFGAVGHVSWDDAFNGATLFDWFAQYRRNPHPRNVLYKGVASKPAGAYWVRIDAPRQLRRFSVIGAMVADNTVGVYVENVRRFSLLLDRHLVDVDKPVTVTINGRRVPRVWVEETKPVAFEMVEGQYWRVFEPYCPPLLPALGMTGILDWHIYVYGTSGLPHETIRNREAAERAADWGWWYDVKWPIKSDVDVTPDDLQSANVVLVGTPSDNRLLARIADQLPVRFESNAIRVGRRRYSGPLAGVAMIYRNPLAPNRYLFLHSAFTIEGYANLRSRLPKAPPDYIVVDGSGAIARAGFFDASWQFEP